MEPRRVRIDRPGKHNNKTGELLETPAYNGWVWVRLDAGISLPFESEYVHPITEPSAKLGRIKG